jgi:hypothetical protein
MVTLNGNIPVWRSYSLETPHNIHFVINLNADSSLAEKLLKVHFFSGRSSSFLGRDGLISMIITPYDLSGKLLKNDIEEIISRLQVLVNDEVISSVIIKDVGLDSKRITLIFPSDSTEDFAFIMFFVATKVLQLLGIHKELESQEWYEHLHLNEMLYIKFDGYWLMYEKYICNRMGLISRHKLEDEQLRYDKEIQEFY